jgi:hypothetical protein
MRGNGANLDLIGLGARMQGRFKKAGSYLSPLNDLPDLFGKKKGHAREEHGLEDQEAGGFRPYSSS